MALGWRQNYLRYKKYFLNIANVYRRRPDLRMYLELLLTVVTISFFLVFALRPTALAIVELNKDIKTKEETIQKLTTKIQNIQTAQSIYTGQESAISTLGLAIPNSPLPEGLVRQFEGLAKNSSVTILGLNIGETVLVGKEDTQKRSGDSLKDLPGGASGLNFSVSVTGSYEALETFLENLNNLRRPLKVDNVSMATSETQSGSTLVLVVGGRAPYLVEN